MRMFFFVVALDLFHRLLGVCKCERARACEAVMMIRLHAVDDGEEAASIDRTVEPNTNAWLRALKFDIQYSMNSRRRSHTTQ